MEYGIIDFLQLLGSLGLFIYGMKMMSEGLQKVAGDQLRGILSGMTSNRVSGIFTGFLTTAIIQSSSATTVMVVSFVNAGLLTLTQSMGVIMGANIGTTITAWILSLFGFKFKITVVAKVLIGVLFPFLFSKREKLRFTAEFVVGFGILFIGLDFLKGAVPDIKSNPGILEFLVPLTQHGFLSTLFFVMIGTLLTIIIQSSSATMAVTLVMMANGLIDLNTGAAMVLGENIGTTITANLAALIGNVHAKRSARFHLLFNIIGVVWMLFMMSYFLDIVSSVADNFKDFFAGLVSSTVKKAGIANVDDTIKLSLFHTAFNITNVLLLIGFVPFLEKLVIKMIPTRKDSDEEFTLTYIRSGVLLTPELSIAEAKKEMQMFAKLIDKMGYTFGALLYEKHKRPEKLVDKIKEREELTDEIEIQLVEYLTRLSESDLSRASTEKIRGMLSIANELERIADLYFQMARNYQRMVKLKVNLPEDALEEYKGLLNLTYEAVKVMRDNMEGEMSTKKLELAYQLEKQINQRRKELVKNHYIRLEKNVYQPQEGVVYLDYVNRTEKIGDCIINISEALAGII